MTIKRIALCGVVATAALALYETRRAGRQPDGSFLTPTGQTLTPAGAHVEVSDRPLGMVLSPDGKSLAVVTGSNFAPRSLHLVDVASKAVTQTIPIGDSFVGVAFDASGRKLYVGGGKDNEVKIFERPAAAEYRQTASVRIPGSAPSGLALSGDGRTLYVALNLKHALAIIDTASLGVKEVAVGSFPYTVVVRGGKVYVSNWGGRRPNPQDTTDGAFPVVLDPRTGIPASGTVTVIDAAGAKVLRHIDVGLHPSAMVASGDGSRLYVANANSDSISVVDTGSDKVVRTLNVRLFRGAPLGSSPNALALSRDGKTLYVANGANNAVAVVNPLDSANPVRGFIPTGWYPTAVALSADGRQLCVASGYGFGSIAPLPAGKTGRSYKDRVGVVSILDVPARKQLAAYTAQVRLNNHAEQTPQRPAGPRHPVPMDAGQASPIRHVFYIIKENRTYDQVFGDIERANGDASLVQFGRDVTPNHHALAESYVLLDNYYAPGDQSALGHRWCTQGYAGDWLHKYGNGRNDANPMLFAPSDFLWDNAKAHQLSVRNYGERGSTTITPASAGWREIYADWKSGAGKISIAASPSVLGLRDIYHPRYPGFNMKVTDQLRASEFLKEFAEFEKNGNLPRLIVLLLPQDHTDGTAPGYPTPRACVADNDLALGRIVEAISRSRYWKESAIFVTEDDAQNGVDHVDGHRTVGMVISPWTRRGVVDSTFYTTINMYRTIEQILGLPVSNQFDLAAEPMFSVFSANPDLTQYKVLPNRIPLDEMNPPLQALRGFPRRLAESSMRMDFSEPDAADEDALNRAIWHSVKGYGAPYPGRR
jgi:YVTN family beta-propeller protein